MRTTVDIPDELRARLLEEAARRGEKGFSGLIQEALERYFAAASDREARVARAVEALGKLAGSDGELLEKDVRSLRRTWR
jgi:metal-responsive CopG/Arc/MetJ family transcriptional regulator